MTQRRYRYVLIFYGIIYRLSLISDTMIPLAARVMIGISRCEERLGSAKRSILLRNVKYIANSSKVCYHTGIDMKIHMAKRIDHE